MTWAAAVNYCREYYDDIATVASADDWIRLRKEETDKGQPDNLYGKEACASIDQIGEWLDYPCTDLQPFICYNSSATGSNMIVGVASPLLSWYDAQAYCRKYHTDLASSTTATENNQLVQVVLKQGYSWFGLFRHTWKWVDRTFEDATNLEWLGDPSQPNNGGGHEDCGVIYSGLIMDRPCDDLYPFFCHNDIPTGKWQIVKLQVNSGLYNDLDNWYWSYNHLPLKNQSLVNFYPGYPNNAYGTDVCGVIYHDGTWETFNCYYGIPFICYDERNSYANRFVLYTYTYNWFQAQSYCRTYHTDLAYTLTNNDITLAMQRVAQTSYKCIWFGLTRDTWKWSNGRVVSYLPWSALQPDNYNLWENCGMAIDGLLEDEKCTNSHYFVCSAYLNKTQFLKLQVVSDASVLDPAVQSTILDLRETVMPTDLNKTQFLKLQVVSDASVLDPAVQSTILDLITQKLHENGMSVNTTVAWKVQPDESIFYKKEQDKE
ncbi:hypothetical protein QTP70_014462 [Hemibagrus guttatus]|uniref:C-type lectin domain-containing protein n=1 Tax=Hemibagrus guttatus TaxID=175788 RepID=A0AAE0PSS7_9TELE|nr:hypothetical protein QTP70_014462 [Hemibagrus guttatus]